MRRILILRGGALGDFIVTLPALAALRTAFPTARIELVGNATAATLALNRQLLDAVHSQHESRWAGLYDSARLPPAFATWLASFDLIVNFWPDSDGDLARHFPLHPAQRFLTAPALPTLAPAAAHYCELLRALGLKPTAFFHPLSEVGRVIPNPPRSTQSHSGRSALNAQLSTASLFAFALHPGSGSSKKNWPLENWLALIPQLPSPLLIILGEAELAGWSALTSTRLSPGFSQHRVGTSEVTLAVCLPLEELVSVLRTSRRFVGHDSGISHLAAACSVPSLLLFGPTDPKMWAPPAPHVRVVHHLTALSSFTAPSLLAALATH